MAQQYTNLVEQAWGTSSDELVNRSTETLVNMMANSIDNVDWEKAKFNDALDNSNSATIKQTPQPKEQQNCTPVHPATNVNSIQVSPATNVNSSQVSPATSSQVSPATNVNSNQINAASDFNFDDADVEDLFSLFLEGMKISEEDPTTVTVKGERLSETAHKQTTSPNTKLAHAMMQHFIAEVPLDAWQNMTPGELAKSQDYLVQKYGPGEYEKVYFEFRDKDAALNSPEGRLPYRIHAFLDRSKRILIEPKFKWPDE